MSDRWSQHVGTALLTIVLLLTACGGQTPTPLPGCEGAPRPIVFVHGLMGGGDNYVNTVMRFAANGYCPEYLRAFDWNTMSFDMESNAEALSTFVDQVLEETGADQVDLVGHSMGGRVSHQFLSEEKRAARVAHYVHTASFCDLEFPDSAPMLVLSSDEDTVVGVCTLEGADNRDIDGADHMQMVTLPEVFVAMYRFFNDDQPPDTTDIIAESTITLSGKILAFGTNLPVDGALVEIYPLDAETGERLADTPAARFTADESGVWGAFQADSLTYYEFLVTPPDERPFHYYRQPFPHSNDLVYLRVLPETDLLLDRLLGEVRYDDASSTIVFFSANQAIYHGRDTVTLDGMDLATPEMAPPPPDPASTIAIFIMDVDGDGQTGGGPGSGQLAEFPFLQQYDAFIDASTRRTITLTMNGAALHIPTWKADSEGAIIAVFDRGGP